MLKYALMAIGAATAIAVVFVLLPTGGGQRPEPRILASGDTAPAGGFVIHPAAPPDPATPVPTTPATPGATPAPPASAGDLDAVMQRLRSGKPDLTATTTANAPSPAPTATPATATPPSSAVPPPPDPASTATDLSGAAPRWASVTAQGTRWRIARSGNGYTVSIDLGGGQVADVHVQPAFGNLDPAAVNVRVDYLRDTIVQNFSRQSGSYTFARDGSVSLDH